MKTLYKFNINKKEKVEERIQEGDKITIQVVDKETPLEVILKLPNRKDRADWSIIYNVEFNKGLALGLQPIETLERCLAVNSGESAKRDSEKITDIYSKLVELSNTVKSLESEGKIEESLEKKKEFEKLTDEYMELERPYKELQSKSAEFYAQDKTVAWCVLNLTYFNETTKVFPGTTFESKLEYYYELDEASPEYDIFNKAYLCFYSYILGSADLDKEDYRKQYFDELIV